MAVDDACNFLRGGGEVAVGIIGTNTSIVDNMCSGQIHGKHTCD